ncbi:MAG: hypothetical protein SBU_000816 [Candidatus Syntrophoarchaeum butanivorans]|uniref:Transposase IS4-like domain-containing protein n=1 Tax=Candidatus Syntropharchaeum butanivorans TaxID=1839936 RepID=A0A1F2P527_9EURY|nr:MAG: hypothetical protein SBU_000816 [Candidatus Syntrophoarchaeum butanivorans]
MEKPAIKRATRGHPLDIRDELRNRRINKKRARIERAFAVMKTVFSAGHLRVTTPRKGCGEDDIHRVCL